MPRCTDGTWCIDDLCHMTEQTLCGLWTYDDEDDWDVADDHYAECCEDGSCETVDAPDSGREAVER